MPAGQDIALAANFKGLNLAAAPHMLEAGESPDTTDAGYSEDKIGLLGARRGRTRTAAYGAKIMGVISFNVPWGRFRLVATEDGVISPEEVPWPEIIPPSPIDYCPGEGFDFSEPGAPVDPITVVPGDGTISDIELLVPSAPTQLYGMTFLESSLGVLMDPGVVCAGAILLQVRINNVWQSARELIWEQISIDGSGLAPFKISFTDQAFMNPSRYQGVMDAVRLRGYMSGSGFVTATVNDISVYLVKGSQA